jgi:small GTP-binding protein
MPEQLKTPCSIGLLAHVDAGKTTLSEALLYSTGAKRTLGRVDHGDAFLDTHNLERARGITIFSKQARLETENRMITLVDTPGHVDFAAEAERSLPILDCAVLVISGTDGIQAHTVTLWRLLERYEIPTFLFINKMDLPGMERRKLMAQLQRELNSGCIDFGSDFDTIAESAAMCDEALLETYLETGTVTEGNLRGLIARRKIFPCCFGSALKIAGVDDVNELYAQMKIELLSYEGMTDMEILYSDYKEYEGSGQKFGIGLVSAADEKSALDLVERMKAILPEAIETGDLDLLYVTVGVFTEDSQTEYVIPADEYSKQVFEDAFPDLGEFDGTAFVVHKGIGRKRVFVPGLTEYLAAHPHE